MRFPLSIFIIMMVTSCNSNSNSETRKTDSVVNENTVEKDETKPPQKAETSFTGCYIKILKRDTMLLHLKQSGDSVFGKMNFDNYEKDSSSGEVSGVVDGDIIKLWYSFQSEGMHSIAELFFKKENESLLRGIGDISNKSDTSYFTDHSAIIYPADQSFNKVDCSEIPSKYL